MIDRVLEGIITAKHGSDKAIICMGARQVGKTTLLKKLFSGRDDVLWLNGDETEVQALFTEVSTRRLSAIIGNNKVVVVDEAQRIKDIGIALKLIIDGIPNVQVVATGSSSFDLSNEINEPQTGRKWEYRMFPLSFKELCDHHGLLSERQMLPHRLVYGSYPDVVMDQGNERQLLSLLADSYLYKDILQWERIQKADRIVKLLQALAYQVGSQVSYQELGQLCGLDHKTVEKYLALLEQAYVVFRLGSFSRNLRSELKRSRKVYFYDNGIRNAVISDFRPIELRNDIGALWENYLVSERIKYLNYHGQTASSWFWRTSQQHEIDYLEEGDGAIAAYEFKWSPNAREKPQRQFLEAYPNSTLTAINRNTYEPFLGIDM